MPDPAAAQDGLHGSDEVALLGEVPRVARKVRDVAARRRENPGMGSCRFSLWINILETIKLL